MTFSVSKIARNFGICRSQLDQCFSDLSDVSILHIQVCFLWAIKLRVSGNGSKQKRPFYVTGHLRGHRQDPVAYTTGSYVGLVQAVVGKPKMSDYDVITNVGTYALVNCMTDPMTPGDAPSQCQSESAFRVRNPHPASYEDAPTIYFGRYSTYYLTHQYQKTTTPLTNIMTHIQNKIAVFY